MNFVCIIEDVESEVLINYKDLLCMEKGRKLLILMIIKLKKWSVLFTIN